MFTKMKSVILTGLSFALTAAVIGNAYYQKKQFYPSVVYITKSNPSMAMLYIQAFVFVCLMGKLMRKVFFGQLRAAEMEHLIERSWYAVTETCLAFTVFRDDFSPRFVALFTLLLFLKCFHWLAEDRIDYMERSPVISVMFHIRALSLMALLGVLDLYFINDAYYSTLLKGASVQLVFGFEYAILLTVVWMTLMKYTLHSIDLQNENPWENKAVYLLYTELVIGFIKVVLYMVFMIIMIKVHTFPLFAIRPMYLSLRSFKKALHDVIMSRRAIQNMNTLYSDATAEELAAGDNVCIICREEMMTSCKKLPCNHIFHTSCLRSWFQRQQTCPTCRMDVLRQPRPEAPAAAAAARQQQPAQPAQQPQPPAMPANLFPGFPGVPPVWPNVPPAPQQPPASSAATSTPASPVNPPSSSIPPMMPMMPFMMPYGNYAMPRPPPNMSGISMEELRTMEGQERENVEARILWLRDIQSLLDGAMVLINQYNNISAQQNIPVISTSFPVSSSQNNTDNPSNSSIYSTSKLQSATKVTSSADKKEQDLDFSGLEGATGFTPTKEEDIPKWNDPRQEEHEDEMHEVRRRRLEKFTQEQNSTNSDKIQHQAQD